MKNLDINLEDKTIKNSVINILTAQYPLSARDVYEALRSSYIKNATYPAVYKALKMLSKEKKIIRHNRTFSLNIKWVKALKNFSEEAENNYVKKSKILPNLSKFIEENQTCTFTFRNLAEADEYRKKLQAEYINGKYIHPYAAMYYHLKSPIIHSEKSINILSEIARRKVRSYLAVKSNTYIDKWCARFYMRNPMVYVKTGLIIPSIEMCETMILGDIIVQIYIPQSIQNYIDYLYKKTKSIDTINAYDFHEKVYKNPSNPKIVILKNKQISEQMRDQILDYFRRPGR